MKQIEVNEFTIEDLINSQKEVELTYFKIMRIVKSKDYLEHYIKNNLYLTLKIYYNLLNKDKLVEIQEKILDIDNHLKCFYEMASLLTSEEHKNGFDNFLKSEYEKEEGWERVGELDPIKVLELYKKSLEVPQDIKETLASENKKLVAVLN